MHQGQTLGLEPKQNSDTVSGNEYVQGNVIGLIATAGKNFVSDKKINHSCDPGGGKVTDEDTVVAHDGRQKQHLDATECKVIVGNRIPDGFLFAVPAASQNSK